ncbi:MAG: ATP-grasp domain-containing protein [Treponema sp.]|jgi:biotin carboxylase|nr:ATP-grasp domain-containing protein [Treponema sp.]
MDKMMDRILILGAGIMQGPAIRCARNMGLETVVVDGDPNAPMASLADRFEPVDLKNTGKIEALARSLMENGGLSGVMTAGTDFSASVAWVAEKLSLPGIPYQAALDASDKERMRRRFKEAGLPSPDHIILTEAPDESFRLPFDFPAVIKPVDNMGGRGCRRVDGYGEFRDAAAAALRFSRSGRAIAEEYMDGPEFSVDAVVFQGEVTICGLADRHIRFPPYFIEMGHTMPTGFPPKDREALLDVFVKGIRALGITNGAAKGDIKLTSKGPMIGEIAARLSGGYMSGWTYPYASGVEPVRGAIEAALGRRPGGLDPLRNWTSAERAFISIPGKVAGLFGVEEARSLPHIRDVFVRAVPGGRISFPENNVSKAGNVISAAPDRETAVEAAGRAAGRILVRLAAPDRETDAFLESACFPGPARPVPSGPIFPPPAFVLPAGLLEEFAAIPDIPGVPGRPKAEAGALYPFPAFTGSGLRDYMERTVEESLAAAELLTGLRLRVDRDGAALGRGFWAALIRGGYQGAAYYIDRLRQPGD